MSLLEWSRRLNPRQSRNDVDRTELPIQSPLEPERVQMFALRWLAEEPAMQKWCAEQNCWLARTVEPDDAGNWTHIMWFASDAAAGAFGLRWLGPPDKDALDRLR